MRAKQDCRNAGRDTLTIQSIVVLGPPWLTLKNVPAFSNADGDPTALRLDLRTHPNPFKHSTDIRFHTPHSWADDAQDL